MKILLFLYKNLHALDDKMQNFAQNLHFLRSQVATYTVVHEKSESEVEKCNF